MLLADDPTAMPIWATGVLNVLAVLSAAWIGGKITLVIARRADSKQTLEISEAAGARKQDVDNRLNYIERELSESKVTRVEVAKLSQIIENFSRDLQRLEGTIKEAIRDIWNKINDMMVNPHHGCDQTERIKELEVVQGTHAKRLDHIDRVMGRCESCSQALREG